MIAYKYKVRCFDIVRLTM